MNEYNKSTDNTIEMIKRFTETGFNYDLSEMYVSLSENNRRANEHEAKFGSGIGRLLIQDAS